jgi:PPIC-type PPIASE domain
VNWQQPDVILKITSNLKITSILKIASTLEIISQPFDDAREYPLMFRSSTLPQVLHDLILDQAIAAVEYTEAEQQWLLQQLHPAPLDQWLQQEGVTATDLESWMDRELKIRKFQRQRWGKTLYSYFLQRKFQLDRVVCSLIYLQDSNMAQELYFRIAESEQSFAELACLYSQAETAQTGGRVGPIALGQLHPHLARMFYGARPGQLWPPTFVGTQVVIARLEASLPVQLDEAMQQTLFNELLEQWLQEQLKQRFPGEPPRP